MNLIQSGTNVAKTPVYGNSSLNTNSSIVNATIDFILSIMRFDCTLILTMLEILFCKA